ncbi:MAG: hypothetical protein O0X93_09905 [Methanocorpusculum sp.]|nr:hypothetical protein [Methanocorpusculum sp.]MDE2523557.1 hypothetical protein [Methanocorpusculum sp.]
MKQNRKFLLIAAALILLAAILGAATVFSSDARDRPTAFLDMRSTGYSIENPPPYEDLITIHLTEEDISQHQILQYYFHEVRVSSQGPWACIRITDNPFGSLFYDQLVSVEESVEILDKYGDNAEWREYLDGSIYYESKPYPPYRYILYEGEYYSIYRLGSSIDR